MFKIEKKISFYWLNMYYLFIIVYWFIFITTFFNGAAAAGTPFACKTPCGCGWSTPLGCENGAKPNPGKLWNPSKPVNGYALVKHVEQLQLLAKVHFTSP